MTHVEILKTTLIESLSESVLRVTFTKKDGTERQLVCTLRPDLLPTLTEDVQTKKKKENPDIIAAYDLENKGWRSFRLDSVITAIKEDH